MTKSNWTPEEIHAAADVLCTGIQKAFDVYGPELVVDNSDYKLVSEVATDLNVQPALYFLSGFSGVQLSFRKVVSWAVEPRVEICIQRDAEYGFEVTESFSWSSTGRDLSQALAAVVVYQELIEKTAVARAILTTCVHKTKSATRKPRLDGDRNKIMDEVLQRSRNLKDVLSERYDVMRGIDVPIKLIFTPVKEASEPAWKFSPPRTIKVYREHQDMNGRFAKHVMELALDELGFDIKTPIFFFSERGLVEQVSIRGETRTAKWDPTQMARMINGHFVAEPVST